MALPQCGIAFMCKYDLCTDLHTNIPCDPFKELEALEQNDLVCVEEPPKVVNILGHIIHVRSMPICHHKNDETKSKV